MKRAVQRDQTPQDYAHLLSSSEAGEFPVLVGGQAVNLWALLFLKEEPSLGEFLPFTSSDCDVVATATWLQRVAEKHGLSYKLFRAGQASPAVGSIYLPIGGKSEIELQVLRDIAGLTGDEVADASFELVFEGKPLVVLNPTALLKAKITNLHRLPQKDRYDFQHVQILIRCVHAALKRQIALLDEGGITARKCVDAFEAVVRVIASKEAKSVAQKFDIDFKQAFPTSKLNVRKEPQFRNFIEKRLASI